MTKGLFALLLAGTLLVPLISPALGNDATVGLGPARPHPSQASSWSTLTFPPVPYLDTMPWLKSGPVKGSKIDVLLGPKLESLGPFLVQPITPTKQFSSSAQAFERSMSTD